MSMVLMKTSKNVAEIIYSPKEMFPFFQTHVIESAKSHSSNKISSPKRLEERKKLFEHSNL